MKTTRYSLLGLLLAVCSAAADFTPQQSTTIAKNVAKFMGLVHYRKAPLDDAIATIFLKNYLNTLDVNHMIFLQSDVDEFTKRYGTRLDDMVKDGQLTPSREIFARFLKRLEERANMAKKHSRAKFDFNKKEMFLANRTKVPWPKDNAEADTLWRLRVKMELLNSRLGKDPKKFTPKEEKEARDRIEQRYARLLKNYEDYDNSEILETYLSSMTRAYDPHSDYMSPIEAKNFDIGSTSLQFSGIGATLRSEEGRTRIVNLIAGGPAKRGKDLKVNESIIAVQNPKDKEPVSIIDMRLNKVVQLIRGPKGSPVKLTVLPAGSTDEAAARVITIVRDVIKLTDQYAKAYIIERPVKGGRKERLGIVHLGNFYDKSARDVATLIKRLRKENIDGLVLDLRNNGGGILPEAVALGGLFIKTGPIVQIRDSFGRLNKMNDRDPNSVYDGPLVVAVSHISASASEIVAGALQDYGRAVVVGGKSTHGKGTVQTLMDLGRYIPGFAKPGPGRLKATISTFYRIAGTTTQIEGVASDIVLPSVFDYMEIGEGNLPRALKVKPIKAAEYDRKNLVAEHLKMLRAKSARRVGVNKDFQYIREDIRRVEAQIADKRISLNETERRKERTENKARLEARKKERDDRPQPAETVFELTLKMAKENLPIKKVAESNPDEEAQPTPNTTGIEMPNPDAVMNASMRETLNILADYIKLLGNRKDVSQNN